MLFIYNYLGLNRGIANREYQADVGPAGYVLFVDRKPVGVIGAKREERQRLTGAGDQAAEYSKGKLI